MTSGWDSGEMPRGCPQVSSWAGPQASYISPNKHLASRVDDPTGLLLGPIAPYSRLLHLPWAAPAPAPRW